MPKQDKNAQGMRGHDSRNQGGKLKKIRSDTLMGTLEERYDVDFGVRRDMKWESFKEETGVVSVKEAIKKFGK